MTLHVWRSMSCVLAVLLAAPAAVRSQSESAAPLAPLLENLGTLHYDVTTTSPRAQQFFDQGLRMIYGFNHHEAVRSFREAARLDPGCAMCYWGEAYALGPNINDPITPEREAEAHAALQKALARTEGVTAREAGLIDALTARFPAPQTPARAPHDAAFTTAMRSLLETFPGDPEIGTIFAAAVMEERPWMYWGPDDAPQPGVADALAALERVMREHPDHPGAHHYYIHLVEATADPDRAVPSADKLESLMPSAGHLVHMPAHIYMRVGRYADAYESNVRAIAADEDYIAQCQAQGLYPVGYYPHNIHFLWSAATMDGRREAALEAARKVAAKTHHDLNKNVVVLQDFQATPYYAFVRFGEWEEMLTEGEPSQDLAYTRGMWHYGRGVAFAARGQVERARAELDALTRLVTHPSLNGAELAATPLPSLLSLAADVLRGELAARQKQYDEAARILAAAVRQQDGQRYNEPPTWHYPIRHSLGAVLLEAGRPAEAQAVFEEDLRRNRENGWGLFGLRQALRAQGKDAEASAVDARFRRAWARADIDLPGARY